MDLNLERKIELRTGNPDYRYVTDSEIVTDLPTDQNSHNEGSKLKVSNLHTGTKDNDETLSSILPTANKELTEQQNTGSIFNTMLASLSFNSTTPTSTLESTDTSNEKSSRKNSRVSSISHRKKDSASSYTTIFENENSRGSNTEKQDFKTSDLSTGNEILKYYTNTPLLQIPYAQDSLNKDFHEHFKSVPEDDSLLGEVYTCSLAKEKQFFTGFNLGKTDEASNTTKMKTSIDSFGNNSKKGELPEEGFPNGLQAGSSAGSNTSSNDLVSPVSTSRSTLCNGEFFISENYISFRSIKNILNLWNTNIIIYLHDIEGINNMGKPLKNKFRANSRLISVNDNMNIVPQISNESSDSIQENSDFDIANVNDNSVTITTVYGKTFTFFNFNKPNTVRDILNKIWDDQFNSKKMVLGTSTNANGASETLYQPSGTSNNSGGFGDSFLIENRYASNTPNLSLVKRDISDLEDEILSVDESVDESYDAYSRRIASSASGDEIKCLDDEEEDGDDDDEFDTDEDTEDDHAAEIVEVFDFSDNAKYQYSGPLYHEETQFIFSPEQEEAEYLLAELELDAPPGVVYEILFSSTNPAFTIDFLTNQNSANFDPVNLGDFNSKINQHGQKYREYQYDKGLNYPIGPKTTRCYVRETVLSLDYNDYINVLNITSTPDVPSGTSFSVQTRYMIRWAKDGKSVLKMLYWVEWTGSSWIKSMIEKSCKSGQIEATKSFVTLLEETIEKNITRKKIPYLEATQFVPTSPTRVDINGVGSETLLDQDSIFSKKKQRTFSANSSVLHSPVVNGISNSPRSILSTNNDELLLESAGLNNQQPNNGGAGYIQSFMGKTNANGMETLFNGKSFSQFYQSFQKTTFLTTFLLCLILLLLVINLYFQYKIMSRYNMLNDILPDFHVSLESILQSAKGVAASASSGNNPAPEMIKKVSGNIDHDEVTQNLLNSIDQLILRRLDQGKNI